MNTIFQSGVAKAAISDQPTPQSMIEWLTGPLNDALRERYGNFQISFLSRATAVADGTTVFLIRNTAGLPRAVVLCSAPAAPDMIQRATDRARAAKEFLGPSLGAPILDPLTSGRVQGLSYAVLPYCNTLSQYRVIWWVQRALLRPLILDWLWRVTECSVRDVESTEIDRGFSKSLQYMATLDSSGSRLRTAAGRAAERLDARVWMPRHVLMHGDLWKGNILIRTKGALSGSLGWRDRLVVIDWAGSETWGYAMYDLIRLAQSMHLTDRSLRKEVDRHCRVLRCEPTDAVGYLMAALGHIGLNLEHFPVDRFIRMAENSLSALERSLAS